MRRRFKTLAMKRLTRPVFEHVVANVSYFIYARTFLWCALGTFVLMFLGNGDGVGAFDALIKGVSYISRSKDDKPSTDNL